MTFPIKDFKEFTTIPNKLKIHFFISAFIVILNFFVPEQVFSTILALLGIFVAYLFFVVMPALLKNGKINQDKYAEYLNTLPISLLKTSHNSPELSDDSRFAIVAFLKTNHPGWSFTSTDNHLQA